MTSEQERLKENFERSVYWERWGSYVSERTWGTVREDYSPDGDAWNYLPHDQARSKAYRWGEDGLAGVCDRHQTICLAVALWNGKDSILKERLFGLSGPQGNHGEDVKEYYYYLDNTPTHSYMKYLYKYPQAAYPYDDLVNENARRDRLQPEYELIDTGIFNENRYFDVQVEYAKASAEDILMRITVTNRGPDSAELDLLPTLWFRNTWTWDGGNKPRPSLDVYQHVSFPSLKVVKVSTDRFGSRWFYANDNPTLLFTENETNNERIYHTPNASRYVKDSIDDYIVHGDKDAVNPALTGTKVAIHYHVSLGSGESKEVQLRFSDGEPNDNTPFAQNFSGVFQQRIQEADDFYKDALAFDPASDEFRVQRQALAGMLWGKQYYYYDVKTWLAGDPGEPTPPAQRLHGRNHNWTTLFNEDIISMPDKWEYPWYASWDLAFHCVALGMVDIEFAKSQLILLLREWYMNPNGQIPAYEWGFGDVNPPVHGWAAYQLYKIEEARTGKGDRAFLERIFQKLLVNFTWWVNRKDYNGQNVFQGGFLGLDNIGVFDRDLQLPNNEFLEQSDGTSWMGTYCLTMLTIALELAQENVDYSDIASKFFEHFMYIAHAMNDAGEDGLQLWDEDDGFYYDVLHSSDGERTPLKARSMVGLIPLFAISILDSDLIDRLPSFKRRMEWFINNWGEISNDIQTTRDTGNGEKMLLSIVNRDKLERILKYMLDESEFLSDYGLRALSRYHKDHPYTLDLDGTEHTVNYEPAESTTALFGGNSNWRGPIWFPLNYLTVQALKAFDEYYGDSFTIEFPTGSGNKMTLGQISAEISKRLSRIFLRDANGRRAVHGSTEKFQQDPNWRDLLFFYEYFNGDNGAGIGANHQTGWTGLVACLLQQDHDKQ